MHTHAKIIISRRSLFCEFSNANYMYMYVFNYLSDIVLPVGIIGRVGGGELNSPSVK